MLDRRRYLPSLRLPSRDLTKDNLINAAKPELKGMLFGHKSQNDEVTLVKLNIKKKIVVFMIDKLYCTDY